jgi:glycosyltransferase involved in cell wall biosynthesis
MELEISKSLQKKISFIIPVYRNKGSIAITCKAVESELIKFSNNIDFEIILINDGSDDGSWEEIIDIHQKNEKVKAFSFSRNFGQVAAVIAGLQRCSGDAAIVMSADLQDPIELISEMITGWLNGFNIVICHRVDRSDSWINKFSSKLFYSLIKISNKEMPAGGFDYLLLDRKAVDIFNSIDERNRFFQGDILWMGLNMKFIPYKRLLRPIGKSQWGIKKKIKYLLDGALNTSYLPIRFMSLLGFVFSFLGFIYAIMVAYARFVNNLPFKGYAPIVILILLIGGIIMIMLGIIGEYLWRIYDETRKRPIYIIKEELKNKQ